MQIKSHFNNLKVALEKCGDKEFNNIKVIAKIISSAFIKGGKLYLCGTGMASISAKYASMLFMNKCIMERPPLPAIFLDSCNLQFSDANDIYEKQITALASSEDVVWGFASDNKNESVVRALRAAIGCGSKTIGLSGSDNGSMGGVCDCLIKIDESNSLRVQELHTVMIHAICEQVERIIFSPNAG